MSLSIGQLSSLTNLSIHTLRFYEKEGIVPFVKRTESGLRVYEEDHVDWFKFLSCMRETGMSLAQLKEFADLAIQGDGTIDQRLAMLAEQKNRIEEQVATMRSYMDMIGFKMEMLHRQKEEGEPHGDPRIP